MGLLKHLKSYLQSRSYRKLQVRAKDLFTKELDLLNTIKRLRMLTLATFSLLNTKQRIFVSQSGRILNANDSVLIDSSSDQLAEHENVILNLANIFARSKDKVD